MYNKYTLEIPQMDYLLGSLVSIILVLFLFLLILHIRLYVYYKGLILQKFPKKHYSECTHKIKSGDVILFRSHKYNFPSCFQMYFNDTPYSHAGVIYRKNQELYIVEAHPNHYCNRGTSCQGVRIYPLKDRIHKYQGTVLIKHLLYDLQKDIHDRYDHFVRNYKNYPYFPSNPGMFFNYLNRCYLGRKTTFPLNCTELVAYVFKNVLKLGIVDNEGCAHPGTFDETEYFGPAYKIVI